MTSAPLFFTDSTAALLALHKLINKRDQEFGFEWTGTNGHFRYYNFCPYREEEWIVSIVAGTDISYMAQGRPHLFGRGEELDGLVSHICDSAASVEIK